MIFGDDEPRTPRRPDCPGCGAPDEAGDDFCHECGHSFDHYLGGGDELPSDSLGATCPTCGAGELVDLGHGRHQCDVCGYMPRDEG